MTSPIAQCAQRTALMGLVVAAATACGGIHTASETALNTQTVALTRVLDPSPERWTGLTNIFFAPGPDSVRAGAHLGDGWTAVELAEVVTGNGLRPIYVARYKNLGSEEFQYVVDTTGRLDFTHGHHLVFRQRPKIRVADFDLDVRSFSGARQRLPYQVLLSDDGYSYARIAEYRVGRIQLGGRAYAVTVRHASRNQPFFTLEPETVILADLDGDGMIAEQVAVTGGGHPLAAEQVMPSAPFLMANQVMEFAGLDSAGTSLLVRPSRTRVAAVEGLEAPPLTGDLLTGGSYLLARNGDGVTLVEFWSTECAFSEKVRPGANALANELRDARYRWVAVVRESDRAAVGKHLGDHPMNAAVVFTDSATWAAYNPAGITPLFVVIDGKGMVRYRAPGVSAFAAVSGRIKELTGVVTAK